MNTTGLIAAVVALIAFGFTSPLSKKVIENVGPVRAILYRNFLITILFVPVLLFFRDSLVFDWGAIAVGFGISAISYFGLVFLNKGIEVGKVGIVVPVSSFRIVLTTLTAAIVYSEIILPNQSLGILIALVGVMLSSINFADLKTLRSSIKSSGVVYAILAAIIWGITFAFFKVSSAVIGGVLFAFLLEFTVLVMSFFQTVLAKESILPTKSQWKTIRVNVLALGALGVVASTAMNLSFLMLPVGIANAIQSTNPVIAVLYGRIVFKEMLSLQKYLAIALIIIGIVIISLS